MYRKKKTGFMQRRKAVPLCFQRGKCSSLSQMLSIASYRKRIKELLKNNKALACALQDSQCTISSNNVLLRNYEKDVNQILLAKMKVKDMAVTIQKLVGDLNDVLSHLDMCSLTVKRPFYEDARLKIRLPDLDTIDESVRSSTGQYSGVGDKTALNVTEHQTQLFLEHRPFLEVEADSIQPCDSSVTEIYNVQQAVSNKSTETGSTPTANAENGGITLEMKTPPPPQLKFSCLNDSKLVMREISELSNNFCLDSANNKTSKTSNMHVSKIPIRMQNLLAEKHDFFNSSPDLNAEKRRQTFVVNKVNDKDQNMPMCTSERRGTFTINEITDNHLVTTNDSNINRRETFVIPSLPPHFGILKPDKKLPQVSSSQSLQTCTDDKTMVLSEDMDLTEIIPSFITNTQMNKDTSVPITNMNISTFNKHGKKNTKDINEKNIGDINKRENTDSTSKVTVNSYEPISPILKMTITPPNLNKEENAKDSFKESSPKCENETPIEKVDQQVQFDENKVSPQQTTEILAQKPSLAKLSIAPRRSSKRKSLHPVIVAKEASDLNTSEVENLPSSNISADKDVNICSKTDEKVKIQNMTNDSNVFTNKFALSPECGSESDTFPSDPVSSDPDFYVEQPINIPKKRIPRHRKSIRPNCRGPYIFKSKRASEKSEISNSHSKDNELKSYDFSSSESEEETTKKSKVNRKQKKDTKASRSKKNNSSVAILERDISLMYHDQSKKKRSMKRKVSFANINTSPVNSESENQNCKHNTDEVCKPVPNLDINMNASGEKCITEPKTSRRSILKTRLSVMSSTNPLPSSSNENISPDNKINQPESFEKPSKKSTKTDELCILGSNILENKSGTKSKKSYLNFNNKLKSIKSKKSKEIKEMMDEIPVSKLVNDKIKIHNIEATDNVNKSPTECELNPIPCKQVEELTEKMPVENSDCSFVIGSIKASKENSEDGAKRKTLSIEGKKKSSDIFGFKDKMSDRSRNKRTFSGVSERSSKKRITADDILEEIEIDILSVPVDHKLSDEVKSETKNKFSNDLRNNTEFIGLKSLGSELIENEVLKDKSIENKFPVEDLVNDKLDAKPESVLNNINNVNKSDVTKLPSTICNTKVKQGKSKAKSNDLIKCKAQSADQEGNEEEELNNVKEISSPRHSKMKKTASIDTIEKENILDLESGGRSRRARPHVCLKEPSLHKKLRR